MTTRMSALPVLPFLTAGLLLVPGLVGGNGAAAQLRFSEAEIYFELNDTDGDLGIHASIDGETWRDLQIEGPTGTLLNISSQGRLRAQGLTQLFFESAEPSFDELDPEDFFLRFPEGEYVVSARTAEGALIRSTAFVSQVLAAPAENIRLNGALASESCDDALPTVLEPVLIDWDPVTESHPDLGKRGGVTISRYEVFVERDGVKLSLELPPTVTEFEVPRSVTSLGRDFKFEIIARTTTGNNTAIESCFLVQ
jgi:hypothetical protein